MVLLSSKKKHLNILVVLNKMICSALVTQLDGLPRPSMGFQLIGSHTNGRRHGSMENRAEYLRLSLEDNH